MDIGLIVSFSGVIVAALAGVLGVWMERDPGSPKTWGLVFSGLIVVASGVELSNTASSTAEAAETDAKLAIALEAMSELASNGDNPALEQFVGSELAVQARANPEVVKKMEKSIAAKGGDPDAVKKKAAAGRRMAAGLPADKPKAGERPRLAGPRTMGAAKARTAGARKPGAMKGAKAVADDFGARAGKAGKASSAAVGRAKAVGAKADDAAARVQAVGGRTGAAVGAARANVGAAAEQVDAAAAEAAEATEAAAARVTQAADSARQAEADARKKADEAKAQAEKEKEQAKKKAKKKAKDAAKKIPGF